MTREEKAVYYKHNGFNCCQSVIKAMIDLSDSDKEILTNAASGSKSCAGSRNRSSRAALRKNKREPERGALPEEGRALLLSVEVSTLDSRSRRTYNETTMTPLETHLEVQNHDQLSQELCSFG